MSDSLTEAGLYGRTWLGQGIEKGIFTLFHAGHHYEYSYLAWQ